MKSPAQFADKVAWITGASSGIGEALARALAAEGAALVLSSNEPDELEEARKHCARPEAHVCLPFDLTEGEKFADLAAQVLERYGRVDYLFNNGGVSQRSLALETSLAVVRQVMEIDFFGHVALTKALLPSMVARKSGHIVVTTSVMGLMPAPLRTAYCAAKHALHGFFDTLRAELWREGIQVTLVCPAAVRTKISENALTGDGSRFGKMDRLIGTGMSPDECARQILEAVRRKKFEVVIGKPRYKVAVWLKRLAPSLYYRVLANTKVD